MLPERASARQGDNKPGEVRQYVGERLSRSFFSRLTPISKPNDTPAGGSAWAGSIREQRGLARNGQCKLFRRAWRCGARRAALPADGGGLRGVRHRRRGVRFGRGGRI